MQDIVLKIVLVVVSSSVTISLALVLLLQPSLFCRWFPNPWMPDTAWNRIQLRELGLSVCLFLLMILSGISRHLANSEFADGLQNNLLVALWITFVALVAQSLISWILWQFSAFRTFVSGHFSSERLKCTAWERKMALTFCSILFGIVAIAIILAAMGCHP